MMVCFKSSAPKYNNLWTINFIGWFLYINSKYSLSGKENIFYDEFEILQELEPNAEILEIIKDYDYIV